MKLIGEDNMIGENDQTLGDRVGTLFNAAGVVIAVIAASAAFICAFGYTVEHQLVQKAYELFIEVFVL